MNTVQLPNKALHTAVKEAMRCIPRRMQTLQILDCVLVDFGGSGHGAVTVSATNGAQYAAIIMQDFARTAGPHLYPFCVNAKSLGRALGQFTEQDETTLEWDEKQLTLTNGDDKLTFPLCDPEEFPPEPTTEPDAVSVTVAAADLKSVLPAVSTDITRPEMTAVAILHNDDECALAGSDGRRLHCTNNVYLVDATSALIPPAFLRTLPYGTTEYTLKLDATRAAVTTPDGRRYTNRTEGLYPAVAKAIPKTAPLNYKLTSENLKAFAKKITLAASINPDCIELALMAGSCTISAHEEGSTATSTIHLAPATGNSDVVSCTLGASPTFLLCAIEAVKDAGDVVLCITNPTLPIVLRSERIIALTMPMNVGA